jgi:hypothetical protein
MGWALFATAAAGCFTGPINHPPDIVISGPATPLRKQPAIYSANATDRDGDRRRVMWSRVASPCADDTGPDSWPKEWMSTGDEVTLMLDDDATNAPFCLWALAIDAHGAKNADHMAVVPQNQAPAAQLAVVQPEAVGFTDTGGIGKYPLYSTITLSGSGSTDPEGDALMNQTWTFTHVPDGYIASLDSCNGSDDCSFTASSPGTYAISFTTSDGMAAGKQQLTIFVEDDQPPCIEMTMPDYRIKVPIPFSPYDPSDPNKTTPPTITVRTVSDDGDPWPMTSTGRTTLSWFVSENGEPFFPLFDSNATGVFPVTSYSAGTVLKVRLEAMDRTKRPPSGCSQSDDRCPMVDGANCYQRVTWDIEIR